MTIKSKICNKLLLKTMIWRIISSGTTFTIVYIIKGEIKSAGLITGLDVTIKTIFYYVYEIIWERCNRKKEEIKNIDEQEMDCENQCGDDICDGTLDQILEPAVLEV